jgi:hypothetical protein
MARTKQTARKDDPKRKRPMLVAPIIQTAQTKKPRKSKPAKPERHTKEKRVARASPVQEDEASEAEKTYRIGPMPTKPAPFECPPFNPNDVPSHLANFLPEYTGIHSAFSASFWSEKWFLLVKGQHTILEDYLKAKRRAIKGKEALVIDYDEVSELLAKAKTLKRQLNPVVRKHRHIFDRYLGYCQKYACVMVNLERQKAREDS